MWPPRAGAKRERGAVDGGVGVGGGGGGGAGGGSVAATAGAGGELPWREDTGASAATARARLPPPLGADLRRVLRQVHPTAVLAPNAASLIDALMQALLEDGLAGERISQIGLAPFANTRRAHEKAKAAGISVRTARECRDAGLAVVVAQELERLSGLCEVIYVDFDIDVIDRSQWPASPGARPGGVSVQDFFEATRVIGAHPKVRVVDLTEYDPSLEIGDLGSLTAGRWFCELLAGFQGR
jgi:hypothetical protein